MKIILAIGPCYLVEHEEKFFVRFPDHTTKFGKSQHQGPLWRLACFQKIIPEKRHKKVQSWMAENPKSLIAGTDGQKYFVYSLMINRCQTDGSVRWASQRKITEDLTKKLEEAFQKETRPEKLATLADWIEDVNIPINVCGIPSLKDFPK